MIVQPMMTGTDPEIFKRDGGVGMRLINAQIILFKSLKGVGYDQ